MIHTGDCLDVMPTLDAESVDAIVTDPPYGLGFMGKAWDHGVAGVSFWDAALRVAKPSAYLLAFGGTRTVHRLACAIEDAGWIIRDTLVWAYASGFPKSRASLKPAWEPIVMARKPGPLRMLDIDGCRIGDTVETWPSTRGQSRYDPGSANKVPASVSPPAPAGRWPANVILTDPIFDGDVPGVVGGGETTSGSRSGEYSSGEFFAGLGPVTAPLVGDSGTYSRFFVLPKADRADREPVLGGLPLRDASEALGATARLSDPRMDREQERRSRRNVHPTVKPTELMRHLVRLVTPPGGVVLDPFLGSGTTALACEAEGFAWIGIEREPEYVTIAEARLNGQQRGLGLVG